MSALVYKITFIYIFLCIQTIVHADFGGLNRAVSAVGGCQNTINGRVYLADDQGRVCPRDSFDYSTGCCEKSAQKYQCDSCSKEDSCCSNYEHCVSCCLSPSQTPEERMKRVPRGLGKKETGTWSTPFEYCRSTCRTTSRSTQHENAFIDERRYCYMPHSRPHIPVPPSSPLPQGVILVKGSKGRSCTEVCREKQRSCIVDQFSNINNCNTLRSKFMCEAGCGVSTDENAVEALPGYINAGAPKHLWPAYCFTHPYNTPSSSNTSTSFNCSTSSEDVERLCACGHVGGGTDSGTGKMQAPNDNSNDRTDTIDDDA